MPDARSVRAGNTLGMVKTSRLSLRIHVLRELTRELRHRQAPTERTHRRYFHHKTCKSIITANSLHFF
jgi:hypothetical protein